MRSSVGSSGVYTLLWFDVLGKPRDLSDCATDLYLGPAKLFAAEDPRHFVENVIGNGEVDRTRFTQVEYLPGYPGEIQA